MRRKSKNECYRILRKEQKVILITLNAGAAMNIKLNQMPATPFEAVHAAADVMSWLGFENYVKHGHECRIDVMEHCDLQVVIDYANSQVVIVGFLDGMEI